MKKEYTGEILRMEIPIDWFARKSKSLNAKSLIKVPIYTNTKNLNFDYFYEFKKHENSQWRIWHKTEQIKIIPAKNFLVKAEKMNIFFPSDYIFEMLEIVDNKIISKASVKAQNIGYLFGSWESKKPRFKEVYDWEKYDQKTQELPMKKVECEREQYKNNAIFTKRKNQKLILPKIVKAESNAVFKSAIYQLITEIQTCNFFKIGAFGNFSTMIHEFELKTANCPAKLSGFSLSPINNIKDYLWHKSDHERSDKLLNGYINSLIESLGTKSEEIVYNEF